MFKGDTVLKQEETVALQQELANLNQAAKPLRAGAPGSPRRRRGGDADGGATEGPAPRAAAGGASPLRKCSGRARASAPAAPAAPECVVCLDAPATHAFVPCGHKCVCGPCGRQLGECPKCRAPVALLLRVYRE